MPIRSISLLFLLSTMVSMAFGQCPAVDFTLNTSACLNQTLELANTSQPANSYYWDFCGDDLLSSPTSTALLPTGLISQPFGTKLVEDNGKWYSFVSNTGGGKLLRIDFGANLKNTSPTYNDLGNFGGLLALPEDVDMIKYNGNWFAVITRNSFNGLVLIDFGANIENPTPVATDLGMMGSGSKIRGLSMAVDNNEIIVAFTNSSSTLTLLNFRNSLYNTIGPGDQIITTVPGASPLFPVDIYQTCSAWYAYTATLSSSGLLHRLKFGASLFSIPSEIITYVIPAIQDPFDIDIFREGSKSVAAISNLGLPYVLIDLGHIELNDAPTLIGTGNPGAILSTEMDGTYYNGEYVMVSVDFSSTLPTQIVYANHCGESVGYSTASSPPNVAYASSGAHKIILKGLSNAGVPETEHMVSVSALTAPSVDFSNLNHCAQGTVFFTPLVGGVTVTNYQWDFGDATSSTATNAQHIYGVAGNFPVRLTVTGTNSCQNVIQKNQDIFDQPVVDFAFPAASPICTNQDYIFPNNSIFDPASNPTWQWTVGGVAQATTQDLSLRLTVATSVQIDLVGSIPGCTQSKSQLLPAVTTGPLVSFTVADDCAGTLVGFQNNTTGADAGYLWDFGDGIFSAAPNPSHAYTLPSGYNVTLTGSNVAGCQNFVTLPIQIFSVPQPDFSIDLPPFSCSNVVTPFQNLTPSLPDSNITGWDWQFGDASPNSGQQTATHTYLTAGDFDVTLTASSDAGCIGVNTKTITIAQSPVADFLVSPACINQTTRFTDLSSGGVQTRVWQIASTTTGVTNPTYVFSAPANYPVSLTVTSANGCSQVKSITLPILSAPTLDFQMTNACATQQSDFNDVTSSPLDPVSGWNWNFDGNASTGNPASFTFPLPGLFNVKMTTTHQSGCQYTLSRNVNINTSPVASFTAAPDRGEPPLTVQFQNTSQQAVSYQWKFYDKVTAISAAPSPVYTFASLGSYSAELTAVNASGCTDQMTLPIEVLLPAMDLVMKDFTLIPDPVTGNLKAAVTILNLSNVPVTHADVALELSGNAVVHEVLAVNLQPNESVYRVLSSAISPTQSGLSYVCAEIISEKDYQSDNNKRCLNLEAGEYFFSPYPNPTTGILQVDWITTIDANARIQIFDSMGRRVFEWIAASHSGLNQTVMDLSFLTAGMYYVTVDTGINRNTSRFIRQ